jgi:hypothetical protein
MRALAILAAVLAIAACSNQRKAGSTTGETAGGAVANPPAGSTSTGGMSAGSTSTRMDTSMRHDTGMRRDTTRHRP